MVPSAASAFLIPASKALALPLIATSSLLVMPMANHSELMTLREILIARLKSYEEEVRSGRHVPPPLPDAALRQTPHAAVLVAAR